ncbi:transcriptional repressor LexA [Leptolyngbya sp. FACHB-261]|uniref:transcriptional repressor LexA n=1 Tax=Leptolyngbya sp. FACHB-261 TaxID=2692806 RepID=UPI00168771CD|nr:transcriptional repressor LexA [Leptolyngbya sp. FACHB-261]MBD2100817.1 repressor LexA [Leptolyngbya sp. FACHB-261]
MESLTGPQRQLLEWLSDYVNQNRHSPSIRQMMKAMGLKSPAPVQRRLEHLRDKGYIAWEEGRARTIRLLRSTATEGLPIKGAIVAGGPVEPFHDLGDVEHLNFSDLMIQPDCYALRVVGDSMIEDLIAEGDVVVLRPTTEPDQLRNGTIVAAFVEGYGTTLKRFRRQGAQITLEPANPKYKPIVASAEQVQVQGVVVGVWRGYGQ